MNSLNYKSILATYRQQRAEKPSWTSAVVEVVSVKHYNRLLLPKKTTENIFLYFMIFLYNTFESHASWNIFKNVSPRNVVTLLYDDNPGTSSVLINQIVQRF